MILTPPPTLEQHLSVSRRWTDCTVHLPLKISLLLAHSCPQYVKYNCAAMYTGLCTHTQYRTGVHNSGVLYVQCSLVRHTWWLCLQGCSFKLDPSEIYRWCESPIKVCQSGAAKMSQNFQETFFYLKTLSLRWVGTCLDNCAVCLDL